MVVRENGTKKAVGRKTIVIFSLWTHLPLATEANTGAAVWSFVYYILQRVSASFLSRGQILPWARQPANPAAVAAPHRPFAIFLRAITKARALSHKPITDTPSAEQMSGYTPREKEDRLLKARILTLEAKPKNETLL